MSCDVVTMKWWDAVWCGDKWWGVAPATKALQPLYKILLYYKVFLCTTKYHSVLQSTTVHLKVRQSTIYSVQQSTTKYYPVLHSTKYFSVLPSIPAYFKVLQSTTPYYKVLLRKKHYKVLSKYNKVVLRDTWNAQYIAGGNLWYAKHKGTTTFMRDCRNTWNGQYIAQSNLWGVERNGTTTCILGVATHETSSTLHGPRGATCPYPKRLRLLRKVALQHHQCQKETIQHHQILHLPREVTLRFAKQIACSIINGGRFENDSTMLGPSVRRAYFSPLGNTFLGIPQAAGLQSPNAAPATKSGAPTSPNIAPAM